MLSRQLFMRVNKSYKKITQPTKIIAGSFFIAILAGSLLLMLPAASAKGVHTSYIDALFTAATSICVTGLVTVNTAAHWSLFGKCIILLLIQLGGLGIITVSIMLFVLLGRKITLNERRLIQESYNLNSIAGMVALVKRIIIGTLVVEGIGMVISLFVFVPEYGTYGIFCAVFHAVSAFCNAGIDILGDNSLLPYVTNPILNFVTMMLIILGGIGFPVWWDVIGVFKYQKKNRNPLICLKLHSKLALVTTAFLLVLPAFLFLIFEWGNLGTIGELSIGSKGMASLFQAVVTRTAGFASVDQAALTPASILLSMVLMFIGASPAGTGGGIKTTTFAVVALTIYSMAKGKENTEVFRRRISTYYIHTALSLMMLALFLFFVVTMAMLATNQGEITDVMYEVASALSTTGLSRGITSELNIVGKLLIIITMYIGRIGPITLILALLKKKHSRKGGMTLPTEHVIIG